MRLLTWTAHVISSLERCSSSAGTLCLNRSAHTYLPGEQHSPQHSTATPWTPRRPPSPSRHQRDSRSRPCGARWRTWTSTRGSKTKTEKMLVEVEDDGGLAESDEEDLPAVQDDVHSNSTSMKMPCIVSPCQSQAPYCRVAARSGLAPARAHGLARSDMPRRS